VVSNDPACYLVDGAILIPGASGTLPELQQAGFHYAK
jgi:hypothetical protein